MKILWITNVPLPEASFLLNEKTMPFGGWLINASESLVEEKVIDLNIAFPKTGRKEIEVLQGKVIKYFLFPEVNPKTLTKNSDNQGLKTIIEYTKPDIVHIFGTEYAHCLAMVNICKRKRIKVVISIQGLTSVIAKHYSLGLPYSVQKSYTFRDFIRRDNIEQQEKKFIDRGKNEIEALKNVTHLIGRTNWDRACTSLIHQEAKYHHCNETLRDTFYQKQWSLKRCERHSIFLSQGSYPIKGLHFAIEALHLIVKRYPEAKLYIGGEDISKSNTFMEKLKQSSYGKYIKQLITQYKLEKNVIFTGILNEREMCERFLKAHVFLSSSTIENSPNSLGEAMILGVPCVSSNVGGVSDFINHNEDGFMYQADATYMMTYYICEIFGDDLLAQTFSDQAKYKAAKIFNKKNNNKRLLDIYSHIMNSPD